MQEIGSLKYQNSRLKNAIQFEPGYTYIDEIKKFDQKRRPQYFPNSSLWKCWIFRRFGYGGKNGWKEKLSFALL